MDGEVDEENERAPHGSGDDGAHHTAGGDKGLELQGKDGMGIVRAMAAIEAKKRTAHLFRESGMAR